MDAPGFSPRTPADIQELIDNFPRLFGRPPNDDELRSLNLALELMLAGQSQPEQPASSSVPQRNSAVAGEAGDD